MIRRLLLLFCLGLLWKPASDAGTRLSNQEYVALEIRRSVETTSVVVAEHIQNWISTGTVSIVVVSNNVIQTTNYVTNVGTNYQNVFFPLTTSYTVIFSDDGHAAQIDTLSLSGEEILSAFGDNKPAGIWAFGGGNCTSIEMYLSTDAECNILYANFPWVFQIGAHAFENSSLISAIFPQVNTIGDQAFLYCPIREIDFPLCTTLGIEAFGGCENLKTVKLPLVEKLGNYALYGTAIQEAYLPNAKDIGIRVFQNCKSLETVYLPAMTNMGAGLFYGCSNLKEVNFGNSPRTKVPPFGLNSFSGVPTDCVIIVPDAQYAAWSTAAGWLSLTNTGYRMLPYSSALSARIANIPTKISQLVNDLNFVSNEEIDPTVDGQQVSNIVNNIIGYAPDAVSNLATQLTKDLVGNYSETVTNIVNDMESIIPSLVTNLTEAVLRDEIPLFLTESLVEAVLPQIATNLAQNADLMTSIAEQVYEELYTTAVTDITERVVTNIGGMVMEKLPSLDTTYKRTIGISSTNQSLQIVTETDIQEGYCRVKMPDTEERVKDWIVYIPPMNTSFYVIPPTNCIYWTDFSPSDFYLWEGGQSSNAHAFHVLEGMAAGMFFTQVKDNIYTLSVQAYHSITNKYIWQSAPSQ